MKTRSPILFFVLLTWHGCTQAQPTLVDGRCEGCEAVFEYGDKRLSPVDTLPDHNRYTPRLKLTGTIYRPDGKTPAPGVILYVYHTDPAGVYPKRGDESGWARRHGYIRGWIQTGADGKYTFYTFRPGSYGSGAAHIHATILEPDGKYYYIDDFNFEGDPNLNMQEEKRKRGGSGIVRLREEGDLLVAERDITLGLNVQNYE
jgi:protocatechuate 3,4-dioxygenase beta subunit